MGLIQPIRRLIGTGVAIATALLILSIGPNLLTADVFHLRDGTQVEGEQTGRQDDVLVVRTRNSQVALPAEDVVKIDRGTVSWELYETLKKETANAADARHQLGQWCRQHQLEDLARAEFTRALSLDPNHEASHRALGHVRVGDAWLEWGEPGKSPPAPAGRPSPSTAPGDEASLEAARLAVRAGEQDMLAAVRAEWHKRVRAIRSGYLSSPLKAQVTQGTEMLLAIRDPLAVEAILQTLSDGPAPQRKLMTAAVGEFRTSASTLGLLESAVLDPELDVRRLALSFLRKRSDPRMLGYLLKALTSEDDDIVRNAADALGEIQLKEAIPSLIKSLTETEVRRVKTDAVIQWTRRQFTDEGGQLHTMAIRRVVEPSQHKTVTVTVFRTEAQEALIAITGVNYGFDAAAWTEWYQKNVVQPAQERPDPADGPPKAPAAPGSQSRPMTPLGPT